MSSYNTFNNEPEPQQQCIICLDKSVINQKDKVTLMNEMHFLIKGCDCVCYAHHACIEKWIKTNAVCPICKRIISFPVMAIKDKDTEVQIPLTIPLPLLLQSHTIQGHTIQGHTIQGHTIQVNSVNSVCIRIIMAIFIVFITFMVIQIILQ